MSEDQPEIPDKIYFKIGEVADIVGVEPYVLRYWESEFPALMPSKSRSQQRLYRRHDVELLLRIKHLLYEDMYTIAGAKKQLLRSSEKSSSPQMSLQLPEQPETEILNKVEKELGDLLKIVESSKV